MRKYYVLHLIPTRPGHVAESSGQQRSGPFETRASAERFAAAIAGKQPVQYVRIVAGDPDIDVDDDDGGGS